jgi:hypothetical protein
MLKDEVLIKHAYTAFNARNINAIQVMHPDIHWPKAFEGGHVVGHEAVSAYWIRQWNEINPRVEPVEINERYDGKIEVIVD